MPKKTAADLPAELLSKIFDYLETTAPSLSNLRLEPSLELINSPILDLKTISRVSWTWRSVVLRSLFKNSRILLRAEERPGSWILQIKALLRFLLKSEILSTVESFTLCFTKTPEGRERSNEEKLKADTPHSLLREIFEYIDPARLTILAPPEILAFLTSCPLQRPDYDHYHMPWHVLSLSLSTPPSKKPSLGYPAYTDPKPTPLTIRPWSAITLNEGSFLRAYSICGYPYTRTLPPSILPSLVGISPSLSGPSPTTKVQCPKPQLPFTITSFSYISLFPFLPHFCLLEHLLPRLQRLYFHFIPRGDIAPDPWQRTHAQILDMKQERDSCYEAVIRWVVDPKKRWLQKFLTEVECGDGDMDQAWNLQLREHRDALENGKVSVR
jgi:hypothetical protein